MNIFDITNGFPLQYQLGGPIQTTFGVQPVNAPLQGINPSVQSLRFDTQGFSAAPYFQGQGLIETRKNNQLAQDKFDFEVQKEFQKRSDDFFKSVYSANKQIKGASQDGFGLNPGYIKNEMASNAAYDYAQRGQEQMTRAMKNANFSNYASIGQEVDKIKLQTQRDIEVNTGVIEQRLIDKAFDSTVETLRNKQLSGEKVNGPALERMIATYEAYKNDPDPAAFLDQSIFTPSLYTYNETNGQKTLDAIVKTANTSLEDVELLTKNTGLPGGVIRTITNSKQSPETKRALIIAEAVKANPNAFNYLEATGRTAEQFGQASAALGTVPDRVIKSETKDLRKSSSGGGSSAGERNADKLQTNREELIKELRVGNRLQALNGATVEDGGKIIKTEYLSAGQGSAIPALVVSIQSLNEDGEEEVRQEIIYLVPGSSDGEEKLNDLLNSQGKAQGERVPSDNLNDFFKGIRGTTVGGTSTASEPFSF